MALEMKPKCEKCGADTLAESDAFICSFECTYCNACATQMGSICPNCGGELVRRPKRKTNSDQEIANLGALAGYCLAQGAWTVHDIRQEMVPFAIAVQASSRKLIPVTGFSQEEEIFRAKAHLKEAQGYLDRWALVHGTTFGQKVSDGPTIEIELWSKNESRSFMVVQSYRPVTESQSFQLLGDPVLLIDDGRAPETLEKPFFEAAEIEVARHANAAKLWDSWRQVK